MEATITFHMEQFPQHAALEESSLAIFKQKMEKHTTSGIR
jgi:hypothetical protein